ncbi:MAG: repeat protein [Myxococcaceae bacterium]|nr:repeat protein [Myxococcaceae bacterium]
MASAQRASVLVVIVVIFLFLVVIVVLECQSLELGELLCQALALAHTVVGLDADESSLGIGRVNTRGDLGEVALGQSWPRTHGTHSTVDHGGPGRRVVLEWIEAVDGADALGERHAVLGLPQAAWSYHDCATGGTQPLDEAGEQLAVALARGELGACGQHDGEGGQDVRHARQPVDASLELRPRAHRAALRGPGTAWRDQRDLRPGGGLLAQPSQRGQRGERRARRVLEESRGREHARVRKAIEQTTGKNVSHRELALSRCSQGGPRSVGPAGRDIVASVGNRSALWGLSLLSLLTSARTRAQAGDDDWSLQRERPVRSTRRVVTSRARGGETPELLRARLYCTWLADPSSDYALEQLRAWELEQHGSLDALVAQLRMACAQRPRDPAAQVALGRALVSAGTVEEGLEELARSSDESAARLRARLLSELGRHHEAATQLLSLGERARAGLRRRATYLRDAAHEQLAASEPDAALATIRKASQLGGPAVSLELRTLSQQAQRAGGHLQELSEALAHQGSWREAASLREELGDVPGAVSLLRKRLAQAPSDLAARASLSSLFAKTGQLELAKREAAELRRRAPNEPAYLVQWAELERDTGDRAASLRALSAASARQPRAVGLHRALRALYLRWRESALAEHELGVLVALEPLEPEHQLARVDQALAAGERSTALKLLARLSARGGDRAAREANLASLLAERDLLPEAVEHLQRAVELAGSNLSYRRMLANTLERAGRTLDAERAWRDVSARSDQAPRAGEEAREHLVSLWRRAGTERAHLAELEEKLRTGPFEAATAKLLLQLYEREPAPRARRSGLLEQLLARQPNDLEALRLLERAQLERREVTAALSTRTRLLQLASAASRDAAHDSEDALELALAHAQEAAVPGLIAHALALAPREAKLQRLAGEIFSRRQQPDLARAAYQRALALDARDFAARYALAQDAWARADNTLAEQLLRSVIDGAEDEALVANAAVMLLQHDSERAEGLLLMALRPGEGGSIKLRVLLQYYARTVLPAAQAVVAETASAADEVRVRQTVARALAALLQAMASAPAIERELALRLLSAAPLPGALPSLLALAERTEAPSLERAMALVGLGRAREPKLAPQLSALYADAGRQLRPFVLWAWSLSAPEEVDSALALARVDRDPGVRAMAALLLGQRSDRASREQLGTLVSDRAPGVQVAALAMLAMREPGAHDRELAAVVERVAASSPLRQVALTAASIGALPVLESLFAEDADQRALSASLLTHEPTSPGPLPAPSFPFQPEAYLRRLAERSRAPEPAALSDAVWGALEGALIARLTPPLDAPRALSTLKALSASHGGLLPEALLQSGSCFPSSRSDSLARALRPVLTTLLPIPALRARAQDLLIRGGGADAPEIRTALQQAGPVELRALLESLASLPVLPALLRPRLVELLQRSPDWPTRMWAARALRVDPAQLAQQPIALVRSAGSWTDPEGPRSDLCSP